MRRRFVSKEPIEKGWSCDKKYCVTDESGTKYLLRITPKEKSARRPDLFRMQKTVDALGVTMCRPIEFGSCDGGVYILSSWIEGEDADEIVPLFDRSRQYELGLETGRILKKIHSVPAPENQRDWESRFNEKTDRKIRMYGECPIKFEGADKIIDYINSNRFLLADRPQTFQHGDYHIGNMMIANGRIVIIDFDRYDFGDPWENSTALYGVLRKLRLLLRAWLTDILTGKCRFCSGSCLLSISAVICFRPFRGRYRSAMTRFGQC